MSAWEKKEIKRLDELMSIKAQLIDLSFVHDTEYLLNRESLDYAEVWFFDGSEVFDTLYNVNIDSTNKLLDSKNLIGDFEVDWDGWTLSGDTANISRATDWAAHGLYSAKLHQYTSTLQTLTVDMLKSVDLTDALYLHVSYKLSASAGSGDSYIDVLIGGTSVASDSIAGPGSKVGEFYIDVSTYTGLNDITIRLKVSNDGTTTSTNDVWVDAISLLGTAYLQHNITNNNVDSVMIIIPDSEESKLANTVRIYVTDGTNTTEITQNKTMISINLSKLDVRIEFDGANIRAAGKWYETLDNFAILWRENV